MRCWYKPGDGGNGKAAEGSSGDRDMEIYVVAMGGVLVYTPVKCPVQMK